MTPSKLTVFISTLVFASETYAHPGHAHGYNFMERILHAAETEWLAPLLVVIVIGIAGYLYLKYSGNQQ